MFSAKNYGLPKDLIEAAKRVHEKQLMEYNEDGYIKNPPEGMNKGTEKDREKAAKMGLKGPHLVGVGISKQKIPPLPVRKPKPKNEEVQFTEEELAEAFAIFLEENYYVDMLTEEDLDYVFENEFPQWLEEGLGKLVGKGIGYLFGGGKTAKKQDVVKGKSPVPSVPKDEFRYLDDYYLPAGKLMKKMRARDARKISRDKASGPWNKVNAATPVAQQGAKAVKKNLGKTAAPVRKPKNEEVQFTEEELAEAFAIFLEENFHVEMLTEEDLDYVFEEEFPQWLEEGGLSQAFARPERTGISARVAAKMMGRPIISQSSQDAHVGLTRGARRDKKGISSRKKILKDNPPTTKTDQTTREGRPVTSGGTLPSSMVQGDTEGGYTSAPTPTARTQVSAKPAASARKRTGGPSLFQQAKKAVRPTPGDSGRTATDRLKYMARRGNKASQKALRGPKKKDWRSSVFNNPDGN